MIADYSIQVIAQTFRRKTSQIRTQFTYINGPNFFFFYRRKIMRSENYFNDCKTSDRLMTQQNELSLICIASYIGTFQLTSLLSLGITVMQGLKISGNQSHLLFLKPCAKKLQVVCLRWPPLADSPRHILRFRMNSKAFCIMSVFLVLRFEQCM